MIFIFYFNIRINPSQKVSLHIKINYNIFCVLFDKISQKIISLIFIYLNKILIKYQMTNKQPDFSYKIVLLGDSGVGKSNIISRFTKN